MKKRQRNKGIFQILLFCSLITFSSCEDNWTDHYSINKNVVSGKTLWETIQSTPNLSKFAQILKKEGYDKILSESQMYTVWAPVDSALVNFNLDSTLLVKEFIGNHISRFSYSAVASTNTNISVLNTKVLIFKSVGANFYFGDAKLLKKNIVSSNGILHTIDKQVQFFSNIWEYLAKDQRLDSIRSYLYSFNKILFDPKNSIAGDVNSQGQTVYLDSVFYNANVLFRKLGYLNNEDSTFKVILPTNSAWISSYNTIKTYFRYSAGSAGSQYSADTLQRRYTLSSLVKDLVFNSRMQTSPSDSLTSTQKDVFYNPQHLFDGSEQVTASNGTIYITDQLKYNSWDSWNKTILVEAEQLAGRDNTFSSVYTRNSTGSAITGISGNKYVEVTPTNPLSNPAIFFSVPNTLSGTPYNIYCVFVPATAAGAGVAAANPCKVNFQLSYLNESGAASSQTFTNNGASYITDNKNLSKVLITSNFIFPYCNYGQKDNITVKLKVVSNVAQNQTALYSRDMLIDCIILEPAH
jgi:hypothetical protein